jgi:hypothetical protein
VFLNSTNERNANDLQIPTKVFTRYTPPGSRPLATFSWDAIDDPAVSQVKIPQALPDQATWTGNARELVDWFAINKSKLPVEPFLLRLGTRVVDPSRFYASLQADIDAGAERLQARRGGLITGPGRPAVPLRRSHRRDYERLDGPARTKWQRATHLGSVAATA